jgi:hypothetical protein
MQHQNIAGIGRKRPGTAPLGAKPTTGAHAAPEHRVGHSSRLRVHWAITLYLAAVMVHMLADAPLRDILFWSPILLTMLYALSPLANR